MAFDLEKMTVSYRSLLKLVPTQRTQLAQSGTINDLISALTPGQLVNLFPRYYRDQLPDVGQVNNYSQRLDVALSGGSRLTSSTSGGVTTYGNAPAGGNRKALTSEEKAIQELFQKAKVGQYADLPTGKIGLYRPAYTLGEADLSDEVIRTIAGEARLSSREGVDAVINVMLNRVGSDQYGNNLLAVASQGHGTKVVQFEGFNKGKVTEEQAEYIRQRIKVLASGAEPDNTFGANEFRGDYYVFGEGRGKDFYRDAEKQGFVNIGGNVFAARGNYSGPYQGYDQLEVQKRIKQLEIESASQNIQTIEESMGKFEANMIDQLDERLQNYYKNADPIQKKYIEEALGKLGVDQFNDAMKRQPINTPTLKAVAGENVLLQQRVNVDDDVMLGRKPFIEGNDFAVPIYTNAKGGKKFDENLEGLTPEAIERLKQQAIAAKAAGLTKLEISGAQTHEGHKSHGAGTETDVIGYNEDGNMWTPDQRATTALGAVRMGGANRVGFYGSGRVLHTGKANEIEGGPRIESAWGPGGKTSGVSVEEFNPGLERDVAAYLKGIGPMPDSPALDAHLEAMRRKQEEQIKSEAEAKAQASPVSATAAAMESNTLPAPPLPTQPVTTDPSKLPKPPVLANGGNIEVPTGEDIVGVNTKTGETEFFANSRENIRVEPGTLENPQQMPVVTQEDIKSLETPTQTVNPKQQPVYRENPDPNLYDTASGSYYVPPSQMRATNRAKLHGDDSSAMINGHFA